MNRAIATFVSILSLLVFNAKLPSQDAVSKLSLPNIATPNGVQAIGMLDADGDGLTDECDNCVRDFNSNQRDTNGDGLGNACDADLDNDGRVGIPDFNRFRTCFGSRSGDPKYDPDCDFDGDGAIGIPDLNIFRTLFARASRNALMPDGSHCGRKCGTADVRAFGAVGDGIADDTRAIQNAINSLTNGGTVCMPPGTYRITDTIRDNAVDSVRIVGAGTLATVIRIDGNKDAFSFGSPPGSYRRRMEISHLKIVGSSSSGSGIKLSSVSESLIDAVEILNTGGHAIQLEDSILTEFRRVHVSLLPDRRNAYHLRKSGTTIWFVNCTTANNSDSSAGIFSEPIQDGVYGQITVIGGAFQSSQYGIHLNSVNGLVISGTVFESNLEDDIRFGADNDMFWSAVRAGVIQGVFGNGGGRSKSLVNIEWGTNITIMGSFSTGHRAFAVRRANRIGDSSAIVMMANEFREEPAFDSGALLANRLPGSLKGVTGIARGSGDPKNLRGSVTISDTANRTTVVFPESELDASYFISLTVSGVSGAQQAGATRAYATAKSASGFTVNLEEAPGLGNSVNVDWSLMR